MKKEIIHATIITMNPLMKIVEDGFIRIEAERIVAIGSMSNYVAEVGAEISNVKGNIVMPGFVNTHTHVPMILLRGYADDLPLHTWLTEHIFPAENRMMTPENIRKASRMAFVEMIRCGTTCFNDMYFYEEVIAEEAERAGLRAVLGESLIDFPTPSFGTPKEGFERVEHFIEQYTENHPLIQPSICVHAPYTCSSELLTQAVRLANEKQLPIQIHVAETKQEVDDIITRTGMSPVKYLRSLGVLTNRTIAAHCVWLSEEDVRIFKESRASIAHCPKSNLKLASGIADTETYLRSGINVGIGTDGNASNNTLDMVEEMRFAALLPKVLHYNPEAVCAADALRMATYNGAKALGLEQRIGSLETGKEADLIVIDTHTYNLTPMYDPYSAIVYSMNSRDVVSSMVRGRWIMRNREVLNINNQN